MALHFITRWRLPNVLTHATTYILAASPFLVGIIEQASPDALARYGLFGIVLAWFMFRAEKRLSGIEHKMGGLNKTMLIEIMSRPTTSVRAQRLCKDELRKIDPMLAQEFSTEEE